MNARSSLAPRSEPASLVQPVTPDKAAGQATVHELAHAIDRAHAHDHSHEGGHAHHHAHLHDHAHPSADAAAASRRPSATAARAPFSLLSLSATARLGLALPAVIALWLLALWAMGN